ncbi:uncharacterized protein LOC107266060 [Cephus cinctus]|uniref:Uncharacterized protein LOC107266060 n=1 Tax=Cephus cinctus TaxID=211228 RepID=A0AAJ7BQ59_CEPCN|nr:uncharacterized protein LOC107266060 [Cephus cinctus]
MGNLVNYKDTWKLVIHTDLSPIFEREATIKQYLSKTKKMCGTTSLELQRICKAFSTSSKARLQEIDAKLEYVKETILDPQSKRKRGLIDGLGSLAKSLFGTMDAEDAKLINKQITAFNKEGSALKTALKNQVQITKANLRMINETAANAEHNEMILFNLTSHIKEQMDEGFRLESFREELDEHFIILSLYIEMFHGCVQDLVEYLVEIQKGILYPGIVSYPKIIKLLKESLEHLPQGLNYPIALIPENARYLKEISEIEAYSEGNSIVTIIKIPLTSSQEYHVNRIHSLPVHMKNGTYAYIKAEEKYAIVGHEMQTFIRMTRTELDNCKKIKDQYLCEARHPVFKIRPYGSCETQLFTNPSSYPLSCETRQIKIENTLLIEMENPNSSIVVPSIM